MGNTQSVKKVNFEFLQDEINNTETYIISTLPAENQQCLIKGTLTPSKETEVLNYYIKKNFSIKLVVYAMNASDVTLANKCYQLLNLGYTNIYVYPGGLFEWLLLQDIYGEELFPTKGLCRDHLKYKGNKKPDMLGLK